MRNAIYPPEPCLCGADDCPRCRPGARLIDEDEEIDEEPREGESAEEAAERIADERRERRAEQRKMREDFEADRLEWIRDND